MALAFSFASGVNSSPIMSHGTGPNPTAKKSMNTPMLTKGRNVMPDAVAGEWTSSQK